MTRVVEDNTVTKLKPDVGLRLQQRREVADKLGDALADAFRLSFNLQGLHWNVEGPMFFSLHKLTEEQYEKIEASVDEIAERIRALGLPAPESLQALDERSIIDDLPRAADLRTRVERIVDDYENAGQRLKSIVALAESSGDIKTADLLTSQLGSYDEFAWMLRATIAS
ncbi:MAG: DNA starvation/stationary phase protection protein [Gammaproteobacteria bacterium]|nr:DNA starvation/stationary phase protection protein [Gammaproteobacteria bacterium]